MKSRKFISTTLHDFINEQKESESNIIDFDSFPVDIKNTLMSEYGQYFLHNYDWNEKQDEFGDNQEAFREWRRRNDSIEFIKNIDSLIQKTKEDMDIKLRQSKADKDLSKFEDLIIPTLGRAILNKPLSLRDELVLFTDHDSLEDMSRALRDSRSRGVLDSGGNIDELGSTPSEIFTGDSINLPAFENFVEENPDYRGVFNDWKKFFDESMKASTTRLNAYRTSTTLKQISDLHNYLVEYKKGI